MATALKLVDPSENELLASLEARAKQPNLFFRAMAHRPEVLKNFPALYGAIMGAGPVARRIKELAYLTCSFANNCAFCTAAHVPGARKAGVTEEELAALQAGNDDGFPADERAAIQYAREMTRSAQATATRDALNPHFTDEQIVELTLVIAMANFTNRFNSGLGVMPVE